ncbi:MAG: hypothetical protein QME89_11555, partial [Actinomycetota bacterium]|nr:hypothetical protein [Actinomycetota bacterium]
MAVDDHGRTPSFTFFPEAFTLSIGAVKALIKYAESWKKEWRGKTRLFRPWPSPRPPLSIGAVKALAKSVKPWKEKEKLPKQPGLPAGRRPSPGAPFPWPGAGFRRYGRYGEEIFLPGYCLL